MLLGTPALVVAGLTQIGGNPVSKGQNTHFASWIDYSPKARLALSTDAGDLSCWLKIKVPANSQRFSANLSTGAPLTVYTDSSEGPFQWIAIVADGPKREEKFKWPSGSIVLVTSADGNSVSITPYDWSVFLSDKDSDSQSRAKWRRNLFIGSVILLSLGLSGGVLEVHSKLQKEAPAPFIPQRAIQELIESTEGSSRQETKRKQQVLTKVLILRVPAKHALDTLPISYAEQRQLWFKTAPEFRARLDGLITELAGYLQRLMGPL